MLYYHIRYVILLHTPSEGIMLTPPRELETPPRELETRPRELETRPRELVLTPQTNHHRQDLEIKEGICYT